MKRVLACAALAAGCGRVGFGQVDATPMTGPPDGRHACPSTYAALPGQRDLYGPVRAAATWQAAADACTADGAYLAIIDDAGELGAVAGLLGPSGWIGITDAATEGVWLTVRGGPAPFLRWNSGEPSNQGGNEDCGELAGAGFNDKTCLERHVSVCECAP